MSITYKCHRFPAEIISYSVWLYYTFPLSFRDIQKMLLYRGIELTYEAIRQWCLKFAQHYANQIRRQRSKAADKWHLDEVVITIKGQEYYPWRAVDAQGQVLDILMQRRRNAQAANKFFRKLLKPQGFVPRVMITNKLKSYGAAKKKLHSWRRTSTAQGFEQSSGKFPSTDPSARTTHGRFKSSGQAQRFLSAFEPIRGYFHPFQHQLNAPEYRETMCQRLASWQEVTDSNLAA